MLPKDSDNTNAEHVVTFDQDNNKMPTSEEDKASQTIAKNACMSTIDDATMSSIKENDVCRMHAHDLVFSANSGVFRR